MSNSDSSNRHLFEEFPPVSLEEWESVIEKDLDGADYKQKLLWDTGEGIDALPFYRREDREKGRKQPVFSKTAEKNRWAVCSPLFSRKVSDANEEARRALERGAQALQVKLHIRSTSGMLGGDLEGTAVQTQNDLHRLFTGIPIDRTGLHFDSGMVSPVILAMLLNEIEDREEDARNTGATFSYDPCSYIVTKGQLPKPEQKLNSEIIEMTKACSSFPGIMPLCADARTWHNAGATLVQELALALAGASEYLAVLSDGKRGTDPDTAAGSIHFSFSVGSKYFPEIAKFRALRLLWKQLIDAYKTDKSIPAYIHAETSLRNKTIYDPYVNMLRTTTEGMSAVISGIDTLTVHPFDSTYRTPDLFSDRIARNSQIILKEEAYFDKVADPAAGSFYIEQLTDKLAEHSWALFCEIEQEGGLRTSIRNGTVQSLLDLTQKERNREIARRGRVFVGTSRYVNTDERISDKLESEYRTVSLRETETDVDPDPGRLMKSLAESLREGAALGDLVPKLFELEWSKHFIRTIGTWRGPEAFEALRLATERHEKTPVVLTLPLGDPEKRKARSTFAKNFFGCGGYKVEDPIGFEDVKSALQAVKEKQPEIVVICSSDREYQNLVPAISGGIKEMTPSPILVLSGSPQEDAEGYTQTGVERIHKQCDIPETLKRFHSKLGIPVE